MLITCVDSELDHVLYSINYGILNLSAAGALVTRQWKIPACNANGPSFKYRTVRNFRWSIISQNHLLTL